MTSDLEGTLDLLIHSNLPPLPHEYNSAQERVESFNHKLTHLEADIEKLEAELNHLKAQRSEIKSRQSKYADIISPRRRIPPEIIADILRLACPHDPEFCSRSPLHVFMLVSREWYRVACGEASFWKELELDITTCSSERIHGIIESASKWYGRAASLPLSLTLTFRADGEQNQNVLHFLRSRASRWSSLDIRLQASSHRDLSILTDLFNDQHSNNPIVWPHLRILRLDIQCQVTIVADHCLRDALQEPSTRFPALEEAGIRSMDGLFLGLTMPWRTLSTLRLGPFLSNSTLDTGVCLGILEECPNLRTLYLSLQAKHQAPFRPTDAPSMVTLWNLTDMYLESIDDQEDMALSILDRLHLPILRSFAYTLLDDSGYTTSIIPPLTRLIKRSGCMESLTSLELNLKQGLNFQGSNIQALFKVVPKLATYKVSGYKMDDDFLRSIPTSVTDLNVSVCYPWIEEVRSAFSDLLARRQESSEADSPLDPLPAVKARLCLVEGPRSQRARDQLAAVRASFGDGFDVVMD